MNEPAASFGPSERYLNRELSWLRFNERVLEEARNAANPLLERLKFLAIFESNLDEFFMVRVSGYIEQRESGVDELTPDGLSPVEQIALILRAALPLRQKAGATFDKVLRSELRKAGVNIRPYSELGAKSRSRLSELYEREIFPLLTPLVVNPSISVPFISGRSLNLAVELRGEDGASTLARVKVPSGVDRFVRIPGKRFEFVPLEELIAAHLNRLFPGVEVVGSYPFRVLRDADIEIRELDAPDLISSIQESLRRRRFGDAVLLQIVESAPIHVVRRLLQLLELDPEYVFPLAGILGMEGFWQLAGLDLPSLRFPPHAAFLPEKLSYSHGLFEVVRKRDVLVHHPFDSFRCVEAFVSSAAKDPQVVGIKQTLYRVGSESPIVSSLQDAAMADKQVTTMVELKARFDESNNLVWARALERAGVHVTYGFPEMKTHCKLCLVVRKESGGMRSYAHIGTGNYNPATARQYTDLGLFTCDPEVTQDVAELFNHLTGFSKPGPFRKLLVAPHNLREGILERIHREANWARQTGTGRILLKVNALVDPEAIDALYEASQAGVDIDLVVRGVCCLRPGVPGLSERIRVVSIVGRFLEHSRVYAFWNGGEPDVWIGSADLMRRNLDRRIEVMVPIRDTRIVRHLLEAVLEPCLRDNQRAWELRSDGTYARRKPKAGEKSFDVQRWWMAHPSTKMLGFA
ncbi:MAG: polyphosphate kinase 1 [Fimbriimonadales bacterium]|nr:polyphosphate kinase 1 [Fimbriimonadales bacterium]